jgi:hypothetical protein
MPKTETDVTVQLIVNVVAHDAQGSVALTRYDADDARWWLPGAELAPFEHPDAIASEVAADIIGQAAEVSLHHIESFRGRRGWHMMFNYVMQLPAGASCAPSFSLHDSRALPTTFHGEWEARVVARALGLR